MAATVLVLNNTTVSAIALVQLGDVVPGLGSTTITDSNELHSVLDDPQLQGLIASGDITVTTSVGTLSDPGLKTAAQSAAVVQSLHDLDIRHNLSAAVAPGVTDDASAGYAKGSLSIMSTATGRELYFCVLPTIGAAIWRSFGTFFRYSVGPDGSDAVYRPENTGGTPVQTAIDAANAAGGGVVPILPGTYPGSVTIKDAVGLCGFTDMPDTLDPAVAIFGVVTFTPGAAESASMRNIRVFGGLVISGVGFGAFRADRCVIAATAGPAVTYGLTAIIEGFTSSAVFDDCVIFSGDATRTVPAMDINGRGDIGLINNTRVERVTVAGTPDPLAKAISVSGALVRMDGARTIGTVDLPPTAGPFIGLGILEAFDCYFRAGGIGFPAFTFGGGGGGSRLTDCAIETGSTPAIIIPDAADVPAICGLTYPGGSGSGVGIPAGGTFADLIIDTEGWRSTSQFLMLGRRKEARPRGEGMMSHAAGNFFSPGDNQYFRGVIKGTVGPSASVSLLNDGDQPFIIQTGRMYHCRAFIQGIRLTGPGASYIVYMQDTVFFRQAGGPPAVVGASVTTTLLSAGLGPLLALAIPTIVTVGADDTANFSVVNGDVAAGYNVNGSLHVREIPGVPPAA